MALMTVLRIQVDDPTLQRLQARVDATRGDLELMSSRLLATAAKDLPISGRHVVLDASTLEALEPILGGGSVLHAADLLQKVQRLAGVSFHHCRLPFTPNMLEQLARKAESQGLTAEQLIERTAPRVYEQFFDLVSRV